MSHEGKNHVFVLFLFFLFLQPGHKAQEMINKHLLMGWSLGEAAVPSLEYEGLLSPFCLPTRSENPERLTRAELIWCESRREGRERGCVSDSSENPSQPESEAPPGDPPNGYWWTLSSQIQWCLLSPHQTWISEALFTVDLPSPHIFGIPSSPIL